MRARFYHPAPLEHDDRVGLLRGAEPVGDEQRGAPGHRRPQ